MQRREKRRERNWTFRSQCSVYFLLGSCCFRCVKRRFSWQLTDILIQCYTRNNPPPILIFIHIACCSDSRSVLLCSKHLCIEPLPSLLPSLQTMLQSLTLIIIQSSPSVPPCWNCVTQLKLYTVDKLSSSIFCCLSVCQASVTLNQISTFSNIWVNCYCWGNSSMVEGRFSKWF